MSQCNTSLQEVRNQGWAVTLRLSAGHNFLSCEKSSRSPASGRYKCHLPAVQPYII